MNIEETFTNIPKKNSTKDLKNQIQCTVEVQIKMEETKSDKSSVEAKTDLKTFKFI